MVSFFSDPRNCSFKIYVLKIPEGEENCFVNASHVLTVPHKGSQQRADFHAFQLTPLGCCSGHSVVLLNHLTEPLCHLCSCPPCCPAHSQAHFPPPCPSLHSCWGALLWVLLPVLSTAVKASDPVCYSLLSQGFWSLTGCTSAYHDLSPTIKGIVKCGET